MWLYQGKECGEGGEEGEVNAAGGFGTRTAWGTLHLLLALLTSASHVSALGQCRWEPGGD